MIVILFGLSGTGKTYIGNIIEKYFDFFHLDADQLLTEDMNKYIKNGQILTTKMLKEFLSVIIEKISILKKTHTKIVVSQGLYRSKYRNLIKDKFINHNIKFIQIIANDEITKARIKHRNNYISEEYANKILQYFEPMENSNIIINNNVGDELLIKEIKKIII